MIYNKFYLIRIAIQLGRGDLGDGLTVIDENEKMETVPQKQFLVEIFHDLDSIQEIFHYYTNNC